MYIYLAIAKCRSASNKRAIVQPLNKLSQMMNSYIRHLVSALRTATIHTFASAELDRNRAKLQSMCKNNLHSDTQLIKLGLRFILIHTNRPSNRTNQ